MKKTILIAVAVLALTSLSFTLNAGLHSTPVAAQEQATLYANMLELPRGKQVEAYAGLTPAQRSTLWRAHLGHSLAAMELSEAQQKVVVEAITLATPQLFDGSEEARQIVREFTATVKAAFDKGTAGAIFARMEPIGIRAIHKPECTCSLVSDWCFQSQCYLGSCSTLPFGCGLMWVEACEGTCR